MKVTPADRFDIPDTWWRLPNELKIRWMLVLSGLLDPECKRCKIDFGYVCGPCHDTEMGSIAFDVWDCLKKMYEKEIQWERQRLTN